MKSSNLHNLSLLAGLSLFAWAAHGNGITVNGSDVASGGGSGWSCADHVLTIDAPGDYTLAGESDSRLFRMVVSANASLTFDNLRILSWELETNLVTVTSAATDVRLRLDGKNTLYTTNNLAVLLIDEGAKVTMDGDGELFGGRTYASECIGVDVGGRFVMNGGTIRSFVTSLYGGGVHVRKTGSFTMNDGTISENAALEHDGGGIYNRGTAVMNGGTVSNNFANIFGGGIVTVGAFTMNGGCVCSNTIRWTAVSEYGGQGIGVHAGSFTVTGGTVSGNGTSDECCMFVREKGRLDICGGVFDETNLFGTYESGNAITVSGGIWATPPSSDRLAQGFAAQSLAPCKEGWHAVAKDGTLACSADGLTGGVFAFDPADDEYGEAGVAVASPYVSKKRSDGAYEIVLDAKGVSVSGRDAGWGSGDGWTFADDVLKIVAPGDYTLSGTNDDLRVVVSADATVTLDRLSLASTDGACIMADVGRSVTLLLKGENSLVAKSDGRAAVWAARSVTSLGADVTIDKAPGETDETARLFATGARNGAGIGSGMWESSGRVTIRGGTVEACGGSGGAGIGSGYGCAETPAVTISGGCVSAYGGSSAAGIGEGSYCYYGSVTITGGRVTAMGGSGAYADIGVGNHFGTIAKHACPVTIAGGTVEARYVGDMSGETAYTQRPAIVGGSFSGASRTDGLAPTNAAGKTVWRVTVRGDWSDGYAPTLANLPQDYGTNGIVAVDGAVSLWLPDGFYAFRADETVYTAAVAGAPLVATAQTQGVTVNGERLIDLTGTGWHLDVDALTVVLDGGATNRFEFSGQPFTNFPVRLAAGAAPLSLHSDALVAKDPTNAADLVFLVLPDAAHPWQDNEIAVDANGSLVLGEGTWYLNPTGRYDTAALDCTVVAEGVWRLTPVVPAPVVARIGEKDYETLDAAWAAAQDGETIRFPTNAAAPAADTLALEAGVRIALEGSADEVTALDLGGVTLRLDEGATLALGTNLTVTGTVTLDGTGILDLSAYAGEALALDFADRTRRHVIGVGSTNVNLAACGGYVVRENDQTVWRPRNFDAGFEQQGFDYGTLHVLDDGVEHAYALTNLHGTVTMTNLYIDASWATQQIVSCFVYSNVDADVVYAPTLTRGGRNTTVLTQGGSWQRLGYAEKAPTGITLDADGSMSVRYDAEEHLIPNFGLLCERFDCNVTNLIFAYIHTPQGTNDYQQIFGTTPPDDENDVNVQALVGGLVGAGLTVAAVAAACYFGSKYEKVKKAAAGGALAVDALLDGLSAFSALSRSGSGSSGGDGSSSGDEGSESGKDDDDPVNEEEKEEEAVRTTEQKAKDVIDKIFMGVDLVNSLESVLDMIVGTMFYGNGVNDRYPASAYNTVQQKWADDHKGSAAASSDSVAWFGVKTLPSDAANRKGYFVMNSDFGLEDIMAGTVWDGGDFVGSVTSVLGDFGLCWSLMSFLGTGGQDGVYKGTTAFKSVWSTVLSLSLNLASGARKYCESNGCYEMEPSVALKIPNGCDYCLRAMHFTQQSGDTVRTAPLFEVENGGTLEFDDCTFECYRWTCPSGVIHVKSGGALVLRDVTCNDANALIVADAGARVWTCGKTTVGGLQVSDGALSVGYGPHGTDKARDWSLTGTVVLRGIDGLNAQMGTRAFSEANAAWSGVSAAENAYLVPFADGSVMRWGYTDGKGGVLTTEQLRPTFATSGKDAFSVTLSGGTAHVTATVGTAYEGLHYSLLGRTQVNGSATSESTAVRASAKGPLTLQWNVSEATGPKFFQLRVK